MEKRWHIFERTAIRWHLRGIWLHGWRFAWHWLRGHPEDQLVYPWCNCMGVFTGQEEAQDD